MIEMCRIILRNFNFLEAFTSKIYAKLVKISATYIESITNETELRSVVFEKDLENRDVLDLVSLNNIIEIMDNKNMEKIALELWTSQYDVKGHIMTTSSILKIIMYDSFNKARDIMSDYFFLNWKFRKISNYDHHLYQFKVWKKSMLSKFLVEGAFLIAIAIIFQINLMKTNKAGYDTNVIWKNYNTADPATQAAIYDKYLTYAVTYYDSSLIIVILAFLSVTFPIKILLSMMFSSKSNRLFHFFR